MYMTTGGCFIGSPDKFRVWLRRADPGGGEARVPAAF